jgi:hypothetical protein
MTLVRRIALLVTVAILGGGSAAGHAASGPAAHHSLREPVTDQSF